MGSVRARNYTSGISRRLECDRGRARPWFLYEAWGQFVTRARKKQRDERRRWPPRHERVTTGGKAIAVPEPALPLDVIKRGFQESHAACRTNSRMGRASN